MQEFIQVIPTVCFYMMIILAVLSMFFMFLCSVKEYSYKKVGDEDKANWYCLQSNLWDFSCQMSIGSAGLILFIQEDDIWCLIVGSIFYILAIRKSIKLKKLLYPENGIKDKE